MYSITIQNTEYIAKDYAVVNLAGNKTLYIRLEDNNEIEFYVNHENFKVTKKGE